MKEPLRGCAISLSGDFGNSRSHENLKKWITIGGGTVTKSVGSTTTHLICSKKHWNDQPAAVKAALERKDVKVVSYDWLEDSLHHSKRRAERKYLWTALARVEKKKKRERKVEEKRRVDVTVKEFNEGCKLSQTDLLSDNYHLYRDTTGFLYNIILYRTNIEKNYNERHRLTLYECNIAPPYHYACTSTYHVPGKKEVTHVLTRPGNQYDVAFAAWRQFFMSKTGVDWIFRFHGHQAQELKPDEQMTLERSGHETAKGNVKNLSPAEKDAGMKKDYFVYKLPDAQNGEPLGETGLDIERFGEVSEDLDHVGGKASDREVLETE